VPTGRTDREKLDRDAVVAHALALADADGLEAVTIRRLAMDLGVTPMALYWHFRNKEELLDALVEHLFSAVVLPGRDDREWSAALRAELAAFAEALRPHPAVAALAQARILFSAPGLEIAERALGLLREAGFSVEQAAQVGGYLLGSVITLVTAEPGLAGGLDEDARDAQIRARKAALQALPPSAYPNVIACAEPLTRCENDEVYFARGLDLLVEGVRGLA
jgi:AcrR family transcriptional regulator